MILNMIKIVIQILAITVFFYRFYAALARNKAERIALTAMIYIVFYLACFILKLEVLKTVLKVCALPAVVFICILYQPELRRSFTAGFMQRKTLFKSSEQTTAEDLDYILDACKRLTAVKRGALIVFPRNLQLKGIIDSGTKLDADISTSLIVTVFEHDTPLHDGAMIINGSKIVAAGCYLPLSGQTDIQDSFGTRHRAALGMAEESDAVVIVVSEETGAISLAYNGNLYYKLEIGVIKDTILALFANSDILPEEIEEQRNED